MKRIFRKLHLWLSIPFGLIISIICLSGAALVFENEIMELCYPERYFVKEQKERALPVDRLLNTVSQSLPDSVTVSGITIPADPRRLYQVSLSKPRRASVYVDQYTGEVKPRFERAVFFTIMFRTHRWLLDSMKPGGGIFLGKMIVGVSTLLFVFILITGIIIWIPRTYKALKNRVRISVRKGRERFLYDLHLAGGFYTFIILLALALTGLTWSFTWYRSAFYKVFGVEVAGGGRGERGERGESSHPQNMFRHWQKVYDRLSAENPDNKQITVSKGSAGVSFNRFGNQRASDRYTFNPRTGEITDSALYKDSDRSGKIRGWIYSVHVGNWGGVLTKILTFIAALLGGTLPLTGYYLWIKKKVNKRRRRRKKLRRVELRVTS